MHQQICLPEAEIGARMSAHCVICIMNNLRNTRDRGQLLFVLSENYCFKGFTNVVTPGKVTASTKHCQPFEWRQRKVNCFEHPVIWTSTQTLNKTNNRRTSACRYKQRRILNAAQRFGRHYNCHPQGGEGSFKSNFRIGSYLKAKFLYRMRVAKT
jgi:hypothetical protein